MRIELLSIKNFKPDSLDDFQREQEVKKVYRKENNKYVIVSCVFTENWNMKKKRFVAQDLRSDDCITYLALENGKVIGFIGLKKEVIDSYMILDIIQVSSSYRKQGIGRKLFEVGIKEAQKAGVKALYISACSSIETIAFYQAMGAQITDSPIKEIADDEPFDVQMICNI